MFSKKIVQTIKRPVVRITVGVLSIGILTVYAVNQGKQSYRSVHGSSVVGYQNSTTSFNSNKVEEHGSCFTVTNSCAQDVFIPTNTTGEMTSFTGSYPSCVQINPCPQNCVLETFLNSAIAGYSSSKVRNALTGYINVQGTGSDGYVLGYGQSVSIVYDTSSDTRGRPKISGGDVVAVRGSKQMTEFELYGITPETKNINRGCFNDGTYWVNSNVYSKQILRINRTSTGYSRGGNYTNTSRFQGDIGINFGLELNADDLDTIRFFGCRSELLPNPDKYCVERVIPKDDTVSSSLPSAIYLKEFTNNYDFGLLLPGVTCAGLSLAGGSTFRLFGTGDIVQYDDPQASGKLWNVLMPRGNDVFGTQNNSGFLYRNTTGGLTNKYGTQMFGIYMYGSTYGYEYVPGTTKNPFYDAGYYYYENELENDGMHAGHYLYHISSIGHNVSGDVVLTGTNRGIVYIPLQNNMYVIMEHLYGSDTVSFTGTSSLISSEANALGVVPKQKLVCVSHTCNPGHQRYSTGCGPCSNYALCSVSGGGTSSD